MQQHIGVYQGTTIRFRNNKLIPTCNSKGKTFKAKSSVQPQALKMYEVELQVDVILASNSLAAGCTELAFLDELIFNFDSLSTY